MSRIGFPYHHHEGLCTIVHHHEGGYAEDFCTVCRGLFMCTAVMGAFVDLNRDVEAGATITPEQAADRWTAAAQACPHPTAAGSEAATRPTPNPVATDHRCTGLLAHHQPADLPNLDEPGREVGAVVFDQCTVCRSTFDCALTRPATGHETRTCPHPAAPTSPGGPL